MAGTPALTMHGARAKVYLQGRLMGIFNQVSWSLTYNVAPVDILGRYNPAELVITHQEPVSVTCTGWRIIDHGPHQTLGDTDRVVPVLKDLLNHKDIKLTIIDRQTGRQILAVDQIRQNGYSSQINSRGLEEITVNLTGLTCEDETGGGTDAGAAELPQ